MLIAGPVVGFAIGPFLSLELLRLGELLYFTCGGKFIKENAVFANALADKHWNCGIDHGRWATEIGLSVCLTRSQVTIKNFCDQSCLAIPLVLLCCHRQRWYETETG